MLSLKDIDIFASQIRYLCVATLRAFKCIWEKQQVGVVKCLHSGSLAIFSEVSLHRVPELRLLLVASDIKFEFFFALVKVTSKTFDNVASLNIWVQEILFFYGLSVKLSITE